MLKDAMDGKEPTFDTKLLQTKDRNSFHVTVKNYNTLTGLATILHETGSLPAHKI